MPLKNRLFAAAATMLLGSLLAAAISTPARAETVLNRGIGATISTLDPQVNFLATDGFILDDIYEGLIDYDANGQIVPGAAEKWDVSDDGLTYTFHLRDGLKWSNGEPLVAQDFAERHRADDRSGDGFRQGLYLHDDGGGRRRRRFQQGRQQGSGVGRRNRARCEDAGHQARQAGALCALAS
jgi:oligopeptide transport system substrate-binding protein